MTNKELQRQLKCALYERDMLQNRLDAIRKSKEYIVQLLDTPTLQERIESESGNDDIVNMIPMWIG